MSWLIRVIGKVMHPSTKKEQGSPHLRDPEQMRKDELYREAARLAAQISSIAAEADQALGRIRNVSNRHDHNP